MPNEEAQLRFNFFFLEKKNIAGMRQGRSVNRGILYDVVVGADG